jgi:hypothetical protein
VASFRTILIVACLGVIIGATFSSGMMDIARNGLFNPEKFYFNEIMWIFVGVMVADILLLNVFNDLGLPTSTSVSIVFDLLGASLGMALYKLAQTDTGFAGLGEYINTAKALAIISGILISVVIAFAAGMLVQYLARLLFTFNYRKNYRRFGAVFGGVAITAIIYFMLVKGAKGASFMKPEYLEWLATYHVRILVMSFIGWTAALQLLMWIFKTNILKIIILVGTFALAMAFAGNDLLNFIGVPLAGLESFRTYISSGTGDTLLLMSSLKEPVSTPTVFLLAAGLIMAATLIFSRQARKVLKTTIHLSSQRTGEEQFDSTLVARALVRGSLNVSTFFDKIIPSRLTQAVNKRFAKLQDSSDDVAFDQVRAAVNLVVASILIASATSLKLPLSTTYVTFMVAMGSSLSDRAWDRESAVYRVTGVVTIISGWFITAFSALTFSCLVTLFLVWAEWIALVVCVAVVLFFMFKTLFLSEKEEREKEEKQKRENVLLRAKIGNPAKVFVNCNELVMAAIDTSMHLYNETVTEFLNGRRRVLGKMTDKVNELTEKCAQLKGTIYKVITNLQGDTVEASLYYVEVVNTLRDVSNSICFIHHPAYEYVDNNHFPFTDVQAKELTALSAEMTRYFQQALHILKSRKYEDRGAVAMQKDSLLETLSELQKKQLKRLKKKAVTTRNSVLYFKILTETQNLVLSVNGLVKSNYHFFMAVSG